ncbi:hypothetical protein Vadar_034779 [Vaccinium darrowii]|uniref:Uncharacterized protein n=1 Tax=Vaccinium darrowii TaxID=229202 RepID=A0ACB7XM33_9ERIC|nr:hypothetical protein Vadar_034779 [Vaccinium darrowii]
MSLEEFLDWLNVVEEIMEFKEVPMERRVPLVATRFRGRASTWWQQLKISMNRQGKTKITDWEKFKKKMGVAFLPHNYTRIMYQRLQNLRQNTHSVDDYTDAFYQLVAKNDLSETQEQLIMRYVSGLCAQFQDELLMYDLCSVSDAHQRALVLEKWFDRRPAGSWGSTARASAGAAPPTHAVPSQPAVPATIKPRASTYKCFKCGEPGHHMADCRKGNRPGKALFVEPDEANIHESPEGYDQEALFDDEMIVRRWRK